MARRTEGEGEGEGEHANATAKSGMEEWRRNADTHKMSPEEVRAVRQRWRRP